MKANVKPFQYFAISFCIILALSCKQKQKTLFVNLSSESTGITFNNQVVENDTLNPLDVVNIYNGGGVAAGDFNNDGLQDLYFTGSVVENKLYLNKGKLKFQDITKEAGVTGEGRWSRGVSVVDINNDGWLDLYICTTILKDVNKRQNLLYINKGNDDQGIPHFREMAAEYGLNDTSHSTQASFFDFDNDGDLDMYLVVNDIRDQDAPSVFRAKITDGSYHSTGKLFRNDRNENLQHPVFVNVTKQAGVTIEGYGHSAVVADFNMDGWKDILVANDFVSNDLLYINNHDGTFTDKASVYFKHTSANSMGQDVMDINNDGLSDVITLDMNPEDNFRKKMMMSGNSYSTYQFSDYFGYQYQYTRNTLQLNQGPRVNQKDSIGDPVFSDIGFAAGIAETDWSWGPLVQDFDNDGYRDLIVTNGYPKDVTDHDFTSFRTNSSNIASKQYMLEQIPKVKIHNYSFRNNGNLTFTNTTTAWGFDMPTFSNGAAYADLDNDGDLDVVINNFDAEASVYENTLSGREKVNAHYLDLQLKGDSLNRNGLGTWIEIYYQDKKQVYEQNNSRGYLSSMQMNPHFGLGAIAGLDSVRIIWPDGKMQVLQQVKIDQSLVVDHKNAQGHFTWVNPALASNALFTDITDAAGVHYVQKDRDFNDFLIQKLLPHKFSESGPALAAGDLNGDGLDDIVAGGATSYSTMLFFQQPGGRFSTKELIAKSNDTTKPSEDMGIVLFDADMDGDLDLYIASGSYENRSNSTEYSDKFYINDGKGDFRLDSTSFPANLTSKSCVRAADFDKDGDLDLFIAGRVDPGNYPKPVSSFIYRNDTKDGKLKFTDVTATIAKSLDKIGMVCDATWTDFDNDGWLDLVLAGEWMPVTFLKNDKGNFTNITAQTGVSGQIGWWTSLLPGDFDNDGDVDYIVGNLGLNSFYRASDQYPVHMYAKDYDKNGSYDAVPTLFLPTSMTDTVRREYVAQTRDDMVRQIISFKAKFPNYKSYAKATIDSMFTKEEMQDVLVVKANNFKHCLLRNMGNGKFDMQPLPSQTQYSCLNGMVAEDFNRDGNLDIMINGNDYGTEVSVGRYDGCNGLLLQGDGKGGFTPQTILQSGIFIPGNGKSLVKLKTKAGNYLLAAGQNRGPLKIFELKKKVNYIQLNALDVRATVKYKDGKVQVQEVYYGSSFLSQSQRFVTVDANVASVLITDNKGNTRTINL